MHLHVGLASINTLIKTEFVFKKVRPYKIKLDEMNFNVFSSI